MILNGNNNTPENRQLFVAKYQRDLAIARNKVTPIIITSTPYFNPAWMSLNFIYTKCKQKPFTEISEGWQFSLIGFHNPKKHTGIGYEAFYDLYIRGKKKGKAIDYLNYILKHKKESINFLEMKLPGIKLPAS